MDAAFQALIAAILSFVLISILFFSILLLCRRRRPKSPIPQTVSPQISNPNEFSSFDPSLHQISISDLAAATSNFSAAAIVGDGGFGFVYKALLPNGAAVAVKKLNSDDLYHGLREFRAEMETLAKIRNPNLVKILGYCVSGSDRILIYEYQENGSLDQWIHEPGSNSLSWRIRVQIILGVAKGLCFLHEECRPCIIHRDVKSSNVLLDSDFRSRVSDFGLARRVGSGMSHVSTQVAGTVGYMPPEYREGLLATVKGDVYSFGILMYEVASGRRPNWPIKDGDGREVAMVRWARGLMEAGRWVEVLDPLMGRDRVGEGEIEGFLDVAYKCSDENSKKRPSMKEVVLMLENCISDEFVI